MSWAERQALPSPRPRRKFASVVPFFVDAATGERIAGLPAPGQKWKLVWPKKGGGQTYQRYDFDRKVERHWPKADLTEFQLVDDPSPA